MEELLVFTQCVQLARYSFISSDVMILLVTLSEMGIAMIISPLSFWFPLAVQLQT